MNELRGAPVFIFLIGIIAHAANGQSPSAVSGTTSTADSLLRRNVVIPVSVVSRFFPDVTQETSTGQNVTAAGNPKATRSVIYGNRDSSKKVTITVDQYVNSNEASSAYREAVQKSKAVPGFKPVSAPDLGQNAFIGTVTQGEETHIGLGALHDTLIMAVTLAGYEPTPDNVAKLISVSREEEATAKAVPGWNAQN